MQGSSKSPCWGQNFKLHSRKLLCLEDFDSQTTIDKKKYQFLLADSSIFFILDFTWFPGETDTRLFYRRTLLLVTTTILSSSWRSRQLELLAKAKTWYMYMDGTFRVLNQPYIEACSCSPYMPSSSRETAWNKYH